MRASVYGIAILLSLSLSFPFCPSKAANSPSGTKKAGSHAPPPPFDEHAFKRVLPTVLKTLATGFSLGSFVGRFEVTPLGAIREALGKGTIQHQGDAAGSLYWLCYTYGQQRLWVVSGEMSGPDHRVTEIIEELTEKDALASADCDIIPKKFSPVVFDSNLRLGMSRHEVTRALGPPSQSDSAQIVYARAATTADSFDETAWIILRFIEDKLVFMRGGKITTN